MLCVRLRCVCARRRKRLCVWGCLCESDGLAVSCPRVLLSERTPDTSRRNPQNGGNPPHPPPLTSPPSLSPSLSVKPFFCHKSTLHVHSGSFLNTITHTHSDGARKNDSLLITPPSRRTRSFWVIDRKGVTARAL